MWPQGLVVARLGLPGLPGTANHAAHGCGGQQARPMCRGGLLLAVVKGSADLDVILLIPLN